MLCLAHVDPVQGSMSLIGSPVDLPVIDLLTCVVFLAFCFDFGFLEVENQSE